MRRPQTRPRLAIVSVVALLSLVACGSDRPADADWATDWERERALVPDGDELLAGGRSLCDELIGELRGAYDRLAPTPTEALDDAVRAWTEHAESVVFDCPHDPAEMTERMEQLAVLAAEIDAGLAADGG